MATRTSYLELTLPENGEYVDNWDTVVNANFEQVDDYASELRDDLVGSAGDTGNLGSPDLQTRLDGISDVSGNLKLEDSADYTDLSKSKVYADSSASEEAKKLIDRLDAVDADVGTLYHGEIRDRWGNITSNAELVKGVSLLHKGYNRSASLSVVDSPIQGFTPNCVLQGDISNQSPFTSDKAPACLAASSNKLKITGGTNGVYVNIDGVFFKIEGGDYTLDVITKFGADGDYYAWLSRNAVDFNKATFSPGSPASETADWPYEDVGGYNAAGNAIDPRILATCDSLKNYDADNASYALPSGGSTTVNSSTFSDTVSTGVSFSNVVMGDLLVITSPESIAGTYVIGTNPPGITSLTIIGTFRATVTGTAGYYIMRPTMPAFGASLQSDAIAAGRTYIGKFSITGGGATLGSVEAFAYNGVYDTGWVTLGNYGWGAPYKHYLGTYPASMDIWVKDAAATVSGPAQKDPTLLVRIDGVDTQGGGTPVALDARIPALKHECTETTFEVNVIDPNSDNFAYTEYGGTDVLKTSTSHSIRVILKR